MPLKAIKTSYNAGELSEYMAAREDINKYHNGCSKLINATVLPHGGFTKRSGTQYIATAPNKCKLLPFEFSVDDALVLEFSNLLTRFYKDQDIVDDNVGTEDLTSASPEYTIDAVDTNAETFTISDDGDLSSFFGDGTKFRVNGSTGNDATWTVSSTSFSTPDFVITVTGNITDATVDGTIGHTIAHWLLNETEGTNVVDDDGGTHNGTLSVDAATVTSTGKVNTAFDLDGQYDIEISDHNDFSFTDDSNDSAFSIACWGKVTNKGGLQILLSKWRNSSTTSEWRFSLSANRKLQLHLVDTSADLSSLRIAHWLLNEDAADKNVLDEDATSHDGLTQTSNTADLTETGKVNACLNLGKVGDEAVLITNDNDELSFGNGATDSPFSIAAWVYVTNSFSSSQTILSKYDAGVAVEWRLYIDNLEKLRFRIYDDSAGAYQTKSTSAALSVGWHFVVATYDGVGGVSATDGMTLYVDNIAVSQSASSFGTYVAMENTATKVAIGARQLGGVLEKYWEDKIDNVLLCNAELTIAQIALLWNDGNGTESLTGATPTPFAVTDDVVSTGWHLFCATYSAPADETTAADGIILYVDGVAVDSTATNDANYTAMQNGAEEVRIGSQRNSGDSANENFWEDEIDEISIFSDVLTPTEVASLYSTTPYSIVSPYTSAEAFEIHVTQSADVMYIAHEDHHPKKLSRFGDLDWTLIDVPFMGGPFLDENITAASLVGFARVGGTARAEYYFPAGATGTLTASGTGNQPFNSNMVGALWLVKHTRDNDNDTDTFAKDTNVVPTLTTFASGAVFIKGDATATFEPIATGKMAQLWRKEGNGNWQTYRSFRGAIAFSWTENEDDVLYAMTRSDNTINGTLTAKNQVNRGIVKITGFTSATVVTVEVVDKVLSNNSNDNAVTTPLWAEGAWSDYRGYPRTVTFFEDRLWWASSTNNPDTLWSSKSGDYENMEFSDLGLDDDALVFPLNDNEVSQIQWMQARQVMAVGAANKEYRFGASDPDKPVTPSDRKATPQTGFGSGSIQPVILNDTIFFFQRQGKKLGAMKFDSITENFDVDDATLLAYKLFDSAPTNIAVQRVPDSIIWTVRTDGVLPTFTFEPKEEVSGWARQIFGNSDVIETNTGIVESVAVIHGSAEDEVWASVQWTISSSTVRHVVRFKPRDWGSDIEDAFFVDSGLTYDSTAASTVTAAHLKGETLAVFGDGEVFDNATADASTGVVTLMKGGAATQASVVQYGLPYTMKARTMRLSVPQEGNTLQTRIKRIHSTVVRYIRSLLGSAGQEYGGVEYLQDLTATYSTDSQDTGENERLTKGGFSEDAYTTIVSDDPVPFTVLSTIISFEVEERR